MSGTQHKRTRFCPPRSLPPCLLTCQPAQSPIAQARVFLDFLQLLHVQAQLEGPEDGSSQGQWPAGESPIPKVCPTATFLTPGRQPHHRHSPRPGSPWCSAAYGPCRTPETGSRSSARDRWPEGGHECCQPALSWAQLGLHLSHLLPYSKLSSIPALSLASQLCHQHPSSVSIFFLSIPGFGTNR